MNAEQRFGEAAVPLGLDLLRALPGSAVISPFSIWSVLARAGLAELFAAPDFSGVAKERLTGLQVIHRALIDVSEERTEAAAATAAGLRGMGMPRRVEPIPFHCDHPFLFLLTHARTKALLFAGRYEGD